MRIRILPILITVLIAGLAFIFVQQVLAAPVLTNNGITVDEGSIDNIIFNSDLQASDSMSTTATFTYTILTPTQRGTLSGGGSFTQDYIDDGSLKYTHNGSETITDSFEFNVTNGVTIFITGTFNITVTPVNDAPNAVSDEITVTEGGTVTTLSDPPGATSVIFNDTDAENDTLTVNSHTPPSQASAFTLNTDGTFSYTHNGSEDHSDSFTYTVCDDGTPQECDTTTVTINITPVNDPPVATNDNATVNEGGTTTTPNVLTNDSDPDAADAGVLTASIVTPPTHDSAFSLNSNGSFTYTHNGTENFTDSFVYEVCDDESPTPACDQGTVNITINPVNDPPVATNDNATVDEGGTTTTPNVLTNDSDPDAADAGVLTASIVTPPTHDSAFSLNSNGSFTYTHNGTENFTDSFVYEVCDDESPTPACDQGTVNITINPVNDPPVATNDNATVNEGGTTTTPNVLTNDSDPDAADAGVLTASIVTPPTHDSAFSLNSNGSFTYTHNGTENFTDSFVYEVCDDESPTPACDQGTVNITITPVNDAPSLTISGTQTEDETLTAILSDDDGLTGVTVSYQWQRSADGQPPWTPIGGATSSTYTLDDLDAYNFVRVRATYTDQQGTPESPTSATGEIVNVNDTPIAIDDNISVAEGQSASINVITHKNTPSAPHDHDVDIFDTLSTSIVTAPAHASTYSLSPSGVLQYTHNGSETTSDTIEYEVCDNGSPVKCAPAFVTITILPVDDPPTAVPDTYNLLEGATVTGNVKTNDFDAENHSFVVINPVISPPSHGVLSNFSSSGAFTYVHNGSENFNDNFVYRVCETPTSELSRCSQTTVTLVITPVNDAPTTSPDTFTVPRSETLDTQAEPGQTTVLANDTDPEGNTLTVNTTPVTPPIYAASFTLNANGSFIYVHNDTSNNPDSFSYQVCDNGSPSKCSTETVTINIGPRPTTFIYLPTKLNNYSPDEPNNSPCTAYPISLNSQNNFTPNDIEDWYRITLPSPRNLNVQLSNFLLQGDLIVYRSSDCVIDGSDEVKNDGTSQSSKSVNWGIAPAGTYYIRVYTANPNPNAQSYSLIVNAP